MLYGKSISTKVALIKILDSEQEGGDKGVYIKLWAEGKIDFSHISPRGNQSKYIASPDSTLLIEGMIR